MLTADLDFPAILAANARQRPSVILIRSDILTTDALGSILLAAIQQAQAELNAGAIVSLDARKARLRLLPLQGQ